jgi:rubrerythrin
VIFDVYNCEECIRAFATEKDEDPEVCPYCESDLWEFSHSIQASSECQCDEVIKKG